MLCLVPVPTWVLSGAWNPMLCPIRGFRNEKEFAVSAEDTAGCYNTLRGFVNTLWYAVPCPIQNGWRRL